MTMSITRWCTVNPRGPSRARSHMCETEQKGSEQPQITTSLQLIRNYCWASKSVSWDNLPNILQERNTSKSGWKFLFQTQSTLALHSWLWLSWGRFCLLVRAFFPSAVIYFLLTLSLPLLCAHTSWKLNSTLTSSEQCSSCERGHLAGIRWMSGNLRSPLTALCCCHTAVGRLMWR